MFRSSPQSSQFIPTKSVNVKPEAQVDYNPRTEIQARFLIPQFLGFIDPRQSNMEGELQMEGRGRPIPNPKAGFTSLIRDVRIQSGDGIATIEEILDLNVLTANWWGWTANQSIRNKRAAFEGQDLNPNVGDSLFWRGDADWSGVNKVISLGTGDTAPQPGAKVQIQSPLYTGIMTGKVFPLVATSGLRMLLTFDTPERALCFKTSAFGVLSSLPTGTAAEQRAAVLAHGGGMPVLSATLPPVNPPVVKPAAATDIFYISVSKSGTNGVKTDATPENNNPYDIGDRVYIFTANGPETGIIVKIANTTAMSAAEGNAGGVGTGDADQIALGINFNHGVGTAIPGTLAAGDPVAILASDRMNGITQTGNESVDAAVQARMAEKVGYTLRDFQYVCGQVSPPQGYVDAMMNQIQSDKGLAMDFKTYSLYKFNLTSVNGLSTQLIPTNAERAYSCLSVPLPQDVYTEISADSLTGVVDGAQNYQYVLGGNLIPDRPIELNRYNLLPARTEALHLLETEKALVNCGYAVRDLQNVEDRFLIARGFSRYNQVTDLNDRSLSLRVLYQNATQQKIFNHYICHLRRMTVVRGKVSAF